MTYRVTFVCTGNICRSPMAEHVFRKHVEEAGLDVEVDSSGTDGWHVGEAADPRTVQTLRRNGYTSAHSARQFQPEWFDRYDLIIALDKRHRDKVRLLRSFDPQARNLNVPDPYYGGRAGFDECLALIEAAVPGLLDEVRKELL
jgi:protein-tyrosine phosphatase